MQTDGGRRNALPIPFKIRHDHERVAFAVNRTHAIEDTQHAEQYPSFSNDRFQISPIATNAGADLRY